MTIYTIIAIIMASLSIIINLIIFIKDIRDYRRLNK